MSDDDDEDGLEVARNRRVVKVGRVTWLDDLDALDELHEGITGINIGARKSPARASCPYALQLQQARLKSPSDFDSVSPSAQSAKS